MRVDEVAVDPTTSKLLSLCNFLIGRAEETGAEKEFSIDGFIRLARNMGVTITPDTLADLSQQAPLDQVILSVEPGTNVIKFKGNESAPTEMPVNKAQDIVSAAAKSAASKDRGV